MSPKSGTVYHVSDFHKASQSGPKTSFLIMFEGFHGDALLGSPASSRGRIPTRRRGCAQLLRQYHVGPLPHVGTISLSSRVMLTSTPAAVVSFPRWRHGAEEGISRLVGDCSGLDSTYYGIRPVLSMHKAGDSCFFQLPGSSRWVSYPAAARRSLDPHNKQREKNMVLLSITSKCKNDRSPLESFSLLLGQMGGS